MTSPIAEAKAVVAKLEATAAGKLVHTFITDAKGGIAIAGLAIVGAMHYLAFADHLIEDAGYAVLFVLFLHYVGQWVVDICNTAVEVARTKAGKDDGAPDKPTTGDPAIHITTEGDLHLNTSSVSKTTSVSSTAPTG